MWRKDWRPFWWFVYRLVCGVCSLTECNQSKIKERFVLVLQRYKLGGKGSLASEVKKNENERETD